MTAPDTELTSRHATLRDMVALLGRHYRQPTSATTAPLAQLTQLWRSPRHPRLVISPIRRLLHLGYWRP